MRHFHAKGLDRIKMGVEKWRGGEGTGGGVGRTN
jgi:hypothetical protein